MTWQTAKYGDPYSEFVLYIYLSKCTHRAVNTHTHTHTPWTHTQSSGQPFMLQLRGAVRGSVPCSRAPCRGIEGEESFTTQSLPDRDSDSQPFDYETVRLSTIRPRLPRTTCFISFLRKSYELWVWKLSLIVLALKRASSLSLLATHCKGMGWVSNKYHHKHNYF